MVEITEIPVLCKHFYRYASYSFGPVDPDNQMQLESKNTVVYVLFAIFAFNSTDVLY